MAIRLVGILICWIQYILAFVTIHMFGSQKTVVKLLQSKIVLDYNLMNGNYGMKP